MEQRNLATDQVAATRRRQLRRRAKRGVVAGYIHELSARHRQSSAPDQPEPRDAAGRLISATEAAGISA
jgi:hypothetical protein